MADLHSTSEQPYRTPPTKEELPGVDGFGWHSPTEYECGAKTIAPWRKPAADDREVVPGENSWECFLERPEAYLQAHHERSIDVPQYYTEFEEFEPIVTEWTVRRYGVAHGVSRGCLERAVRLANGPGHIDHETLEVHLCETDRLFVAGQRGTFLVDLVPLQKKHLDRTPPAAAHTEIREFAIPEDDPTLQEGLRTFIDLFDTHAETSIDAYDGHRSLTHIFQTESGRRVYAAEGLLGRLGEMHRDPSDCYGTYVHECEGETYESEWDASTPVDERGTERFQGIVVGYRHQWDEQEFVMSDGVHELRSCVEHICLQLRPEKYDHFDVNVLSAERTIDSWTLA